MIGVDYNVALAGNCPVQGDVTILRATAAGEEQRYAYFRARGAAWSLEVYPAGITTIQVWNELPEAESEWFIRLPWGAWPDAGWMEYDQAQVLIAWALEQWARGCPSDPPAGMLPTPPSMGPRRPSGPTPKRRPSSRDPLNRFWRPRRDYLL